MDLRERWARRSERARWLLALTPLWLAIVFALVTQPWQGTPWAH